MCIDLVNSLYYRAKKVTIVHPGVNPVTRCHSFEIHYKHNYKCVTCDFRYGSFHVISTQKNDTLSGFSSKNLIRLRRNLTSPNLIRQLF